MGIKIYGVSARTKRVESVRIFFGKRGSEGQFFAILSGRLLWTAPYYRKRAKVTIVQCSTFASSAFYAYFLLHT